jgi:hypothetical protein
MSLANCEKPDTGSFTAPEIVHRIDLKHHIGFVLSSDRPERIEELLDEYTVRIASEFHATMPAQESVAH